MVIEDGLQNKFSIDVDEVMLCSLILVLGNGRDADG